MRAYPLILTALLAGCSTFRPEAPSPLPSNAILPCRALAQPSDKLDMGQLLNYTVEVVQDYNECRARHQGLIDYLRK